MARRRIAPDARGGSRRAPAQRIPAAVLVPLVERAGDWTVLLTQRAATLKDHAGQISFPGGRIEPGDPDPWRAALREAHEEIGLAASFVDSRATCRITGWARDFGSPRWWRSSIRRSSSRSRPPRCTMPSKCRCDFILDAANHKPRQLRMADLTVEVYDIPYGERIIWGATAGMLMTFRRCCRPGRRR